MQFFYTLLEKANKRGAAYTSLDAMKIFAIVNMTVDHIGLYFFPHDLWFRAVGRITFPVWFFLVGYSRSRKLETILWIYAFLLLAVQPFAGIHIFPLNALFSILLSRVALNFCEDRKWLPDKLPELTTVCVLAVFKTFPYFDYGSIAFLYALMGRMVRQHETRYFHFVVITSYLLFVYWQQVWFHFNPLQLAYVIIGSAWVVWWLARCPNRIIWPQWRHSAFKTFIAVLSRNTLPYYFYHRMIFTIVFIIALRGIRFQLKW